MRNETLSVIDESLRNNTLPWAVPAMAMLWIAPLLAQTNLTRPPYGRTRCQPYHPSAAFAGA